MHPQPPLSDPVTFNINTQPSTNHGSSGVEGDKRVWWEAGWSVRVYEKKEHMRESVKGEVSTCPWVSLPQRARVLHWQYSDITIFPKACINGKFVWENVLTHERRTCLLLTWCNTFCGLSLAQWTERLEWGHPLHKENQFNCETTRELVNVNIIKGCKWSDSVKTAVFYLQW